MHCKKNMELAAAFVDKAYIKQGSQSMDQRARQVTALLSHRQLPASGWPDADIEYFINECTLDHSLHCTAPHCTLTHCTLTPRFSELDGLQPL